MNLKIHHLGYLVKNITNSADILLSMGFESMGEKIQDEARKVDILFLRKDGYTVELVAPESKESPYYPLLARYRNAIYHICYETDKPAEDSAALQEAGFRIMVPPAEAIAIGGRKVTFFIHPQMGIVELLDSRVK